MSDTQSTSTSYYDLSRYAVILRRRWWVVVLCTILGVAAAIGYAESRSREITATALVTINLNTAADFSAQKPASQLIDPITEEQLVRTAAVSKAAAKTMQQAGFDVTATDVHRASTGSVISDSVLAKITYTSTSRTEAENGADAVAQAYLDYRGAQAAGRVSRITASLTTRQKALQGQLQTINSVLANAPSGSARAAAALSDRQIVNAQLTSLVSQVNGLQAVDVSGGSLDTSAADASVSISPHKTLLAEVGLLLGLVIGLVAAFVVGSLDRRVRDALDIERAGSAGVLARLTGTSATFPPTGVDLDDMRSLRERLLAVLPEDSPVLAVGDLTQRTSDVGPNLAYVVCETGRRVDLVLSAVDSAYVQRVVDGFGLTDEGEVDGVHLYSGGPLDVLVAPPSLIATPGVIAERRANEGSETDFTVVALAPDSARSQFLGAARLGGAAVLVVNRNKTRKARLTQLVDDLSGVGAVVYGAVLVPTKRRLTQGPATPSHAVSPLSDLPGVADTPRSADSRTEDVQETRV